MGAIRRPTPRGSRRRDCRQEEAVPAGSRQELQSKAERGLGRSRREEAHLTGRAWGGKQQEHRGGKMTENEVQLGSPAHEARGCSGGSTPLPSACSEQCHVCEVAPRGSGHGSAARTAGTPPGISPAQSLPAPGERQGWHLGTGTRWYCLGEWEVGRREKEQASRKQKGSRQTVAPPALKSH